jgi:hypothetical protein
MPWRMTWYFLYFTLLWWQYFLYVTLYWCFGIFCMLHLIFLTHDKVFFACYTQLLATVFFCTTGDKVFFVYYTWRQMPLTSFVLQLTGDSIFCMLQSTGDQVFFVYCTWHQTVPPSNRESRSLQPCHSSLLLWFPTLYHTWEKDSHSFLIQLKPPSAQHNSRVYILVEG